MRSRDLFLFFFRLHLLPNFLYYKHQEVNMITNFKTTSISEELAIMNMADVDFTMRGEPAELAKDEYYLETFNRRREMEAKGYVLNPHFDENMSWRKDKHSDRPYDKFLDFDCNEFVTPEELQWYEDKCKAVSFGYTLYQRLLTEEEQEEDYKIYCEEFHKVA